MTGKASPSEYETRQKLFDLVVDDLYGPANGPEEEVHEQRVRDRYLVGVLAPRDTRLDMGELDDVADDSRTDVDESGSEESKPAATSMQPSSIGMTFAVDGNVDEIRVRARWGQYDRQPSEFEINENTGEPLRIWKRTQVDELSKPIPLADGPLEVWQPWRNRERVVVRGQARDRGDHWIVTVFLVNEQRIPKQLKDEAYLFQPELEVWSPQTEAPFVRRSPHVKLPNETDLAAREREGLEMAYRNRVEFAVGHGVAVHAETSESDPTRSTRLETHIIPSHEINPTIVPDESDRPEMAGVELDMRRLADADPGALGEMLGPLLDGYESWIDEQEDRVESASGNLGDYTEAGRQAITRCREALERMRSGLDLVQSEDDAFEAFRFMNRAMALQRIRTEYSLRVRRGDEAPSIDDLDVPENRSWRPFQIAFILLNIPAMADLKHPDRSVDPSAIADLLWFPTGGGKTEAYLGVTAFTLAIRRLQGIVEGRDGQYGVAVLMRYTLRLLTIQQYQRAAALICACERIRQKAADRGDYRWGEEPFRIGLWVGFRSTPTRTKDSGHIVRRARANNGRTPTGSGTPLQLTNCPWCGAELELARDVDVETYKQGRARTFVYCGDELGTCPFSRRQSPDEGIPVVSVDEEIYRLLPSLVIATVDKFAQMPWKGETQMLFGQVDARCPRHGFVSPEIEDASYHPEKGDLPRVQAEEWPDLRPPDLIIQDELHLISGPLGSLTGLYETAVDGMSTWEVDGEEVRPKVVASTATVRRAHEQIKSIFDRGVEIFPPQGLDIEDNFFSLQKEPTEEKPGRMYMGICAPGKRFRAIMIRVYVAFLAAAEKLFQEYGQAVDPWKTLVGYFNSMRDLGGVRRLAEDDIRNRLMSMDQRNLAKRMLNKVEELNSRKSAEEIPEILDLLEVKHKTDDQWEQFKQNNPDARRAIDILLATNMISVGVDVNRLGLMVVANQPKGTSEYIQATSRVGRRHPGIVCTVFNWSRPRDISHYETFEHYHSTFYKHVEPISVTPFAPRAVDRGLAALLVSLVRLASDEFNANEAADDVELGDDVVEEAIDTICKRVADVQHREAAKELEQRIRSLMDHWERSREQYQAGETLGYRGKADGRTVGLLSNPGVGQWRNFTCLNSLRNVEPTANLVLNFKQDGSEPVYRTREAASSDEEDKGTENG